ncbi:alkaline phosphatase PafA [Cellulophaga fucicola]|uniref:Predicted pyrophosphatase or phosphodiesterase, AlkP superfamily n=1 Tax=Cellulophaga fucicola TaxID=76595 RepID=A0A1K1P4A5_9FLAO|nr:alkaline phosphatase PafA [Cellulophaga fucicola]SFW42285.1 Predicted pyrophosphatase or phosphodiesterase, AlkP superfamily [Cellulophaga fucicola]
MKRRLIAALLAVFFVSNTEGINAQKKSKRKSKSDVEVQNITSLSTTPKLVVGIIVDQMRYDYLTRFWDQYGGDGFKRMVNEGFTAKNHHYNYSPTSTGPGHTSVYTGTTPAMHGIIGNNWYDKDLGVNVYCAGDSNYNSVGTTGSEGKMSPNRMLTTTVTDQLRLHTQMKGKVIAVAIKDRGAVLPGGHAANAAYWFVGKDEANFITSSYYMNSLPKWVTSFNSSDAAEKYKKTWTTLKDINTYVESGTDENNYEGKFKGETSTSFPHNLPAIWDDNNGFDIIKATPYGNSLTTDFAIAALKGENLGKDAVTDFLAVSFSSTDYVGHQFGVNSKEVEDTYLRLDQDLARLFKELDTEVGKGEYTVFLSADHAAVQVPTYLKDNKIPGEYISYKEISAKLNEWSNFKFGSEDLIKNVSNDQIFLDHKVIANLDLDPKTVQEAFANELLTFSDVDKTYTAYQMWQNNYTRGIPYVVQNGYNQKRSGDVIVVLKPGYISYSRTGSTHGSPRVYDTHVPLLFFGKGIKKGSTVQLTEIPDIAPTVSALLGMAAPNGTTGKPIEAVLQN